MAFDIQNLSIGTGGGAALSDAKPAAIKINVLSDGDGTTGTVGKFLTMQAAGVAKFDVKTTGDAGFAGLVGIGSASYAATSPALKGSSTTLQVRLADDSALTDLTAKNFTATTGTITTSTPVISATQTWNAAADFTGFLLNVTNTSSNTTSKFLDFQLAGTTYFAVGRDGYISSLGGALLGGNQCYIRATTGASTGAIWIPGGNTNSYYGFTTNTTAGSASTMSAIIWRVSAGVIGIRGASSTAGGALNFLEQTAPAAPSTNQVTIYAEDNGSGKTRLMAIFPTGAAQQIAIEP